MKRLLLSLLLIFTNNTYVLPQEGQARSALANSEQLAAFVDLVSQHAENDFYNRVAEKKAQFAETTLPELKAEQAKALMMYYFMVDDRENLQKYILELRGVSIKAQDQVNLALADLYLGFNEEPSIDGVARLVESWKQGLPKKLLADKYIQIHADLVMTYAKLRLQVFPFELQYLINDLETIGDDPSFALETHVILYSIVARGWSVKQSLEYAEQFIAHAGKYNLPVHRYIVLYNVAIILPSKKYAEELVYLAKRYVEMAGRQQNNEELFFGYERLGVAMRENEQYAEAIEAFEKAQTFEELVGKRWIAQINMMKAETYFYMNELENGTISLQKAKDFYDNNTNEFFADTNYINRVLAKKAIMKGETKAALEYYDDYIEIHREGIEQQRLENIDGVRVSMQVLIEQAKKSQQLAEQHLRHFQFISGALFLLTIGIIWLAFKQLKTSTELKKKTVELKKLSREDGLTKLYNRSFWEGQAQTQYENLRRYENYKASLVLFDIDDFKVINDTYGHVIGDAVLKKVAQITREQIREIDIAGRYGGEEFAILLPNTGLLDAIALAERIRKEFETSGIEFGTQEIKFTASFGISEYKEFHKDTKDWINEADIALYVSKDKGKNQCTPFE